MAVTEWQVVCPAFVDGAPAATLGLVVNGGGTGDGPGPDPLPEYGRERPPWRR